MNDQRFEPKVFNARDFGAKGDGITDDTAAIQAAFDAASAYPGETVVAGFSHNLVERVLPSRATESDEPSVVDLSPKLTTTITGFVEADSVVLDDPNP